MHSADKPVCHSGGGAALGGVCAAGRTEKQLPADRKPLLGTTAIYYYTSYEPIKYSVLQKNSSAIENIFKWQTRMYLIENGRIFIFYKYIPSSLFSR